VAGPSIGFSRHGEIFCDGTRTDAHDKAGILPMPAHRSEFPPAIPRRVASQQRPLPFRPDTLHGIKSNSSRQAHASGFYAWQKKFTTTA
jgi:hypothetical protein